MTTPAMRGLQYIYIDQLPRFAGEISPDALLIISDPTEAQQEMRTKVVQYRQIMTAAPGPGPSGGVTQQQLADEMALRAAGDEIQYQPIATGAQLLGFLGDQETSDEVGVAYFSAPIEEVYKGEDHRFVPGDLVWFPPRSFVGKTFANLLRHVHDFAFGSAGDTDQFAALARGNAASSQTLLILSTATYTAFTGGQQYSILAGDIWVVYPRTTVPHRFLPLQMLLAAGGYSNDRMRIVPVNGLPGIDAAASLDGDYWLVDPDVARGIDISEATRWQLNIVGSDNIINERTLVHEVDPWAPSRRIQAVVNVSDAEEANVQTALASTPGRVRFALRVLNVNAQVLVRYYEMPINAAFVAPTGGEAKLSQAQQIGLLSIHPASSTIDYTPGKLDDALKGTIRLVVANPELLTGDIWVQGSIDGQPVLAREKWAATTGTLDFPITDQLSRLIGQNPALDIQLQFYNDAAASDAANLVETLRYGIGLQRLPRPLHQAVAVNSAATAVDADDGVTADLAMGFNTVLTISGGEDALYLTIRATQDATGNRTLTFGGTDLELSTAANARDRLLFQRRGAAWDYIGAIKAG